MEIKFSNLFSALRECIVYYTRMKIMSQRSFNLVVCLQIYAKNWNLICLVRHEDERLPVY